MHLGFPRDVRGLHKKYGVNPDMAMFGKALGNGYAITAVIGKREVMEAAQKSFISSTFWTERMGPTAALKTLEIMKREKSWEKITQTGISIRKRWQSLADTNGIEIEHRGLPPLAGFSFKSPHALAYKSLMTQEMLAKGFLASNSVYSCIKHTPEITDRYFEALASVLTLVAECESGRDVSALLRGPVCHNEFKRLN